MSQNIETSPVLITLADFKTKSWLIENNFLSEPTLYTSSEGGRNKRDVSLISSSFNGDGELGNNRSKRAAYTRDPDRQEKM